MSKEESLSHLYEEKTQTSAFVSKETKESGKDRFIPRGMYKVILLHWEGGW